MMTLQFMKKSTVRGTVSLGRGRYDYVFSDDVSETVFARPRPENNSQVFSRCFEVSRTYWVLRYRSRELTLQLGSGVRMSVGTSIWRPQLRLTDTICVSVELEVLVSARNVRFRLTAAGLRCPVHEGEAD